MSYGAERPGTERLAPIEWDLQVKERAQKPPLGRATPHCNSTLTGPFGLGSFGFGGSSFSAPAAGAAALALAVVPAPSTAFLTFFFFGSFSAPSSSSPFRFLFFLGASVVLVVGGPDFLLGTFLVA